SQLVARLELPSETTNQVYAMQQDFQQRVGAIRGNTSLPVADRNAQFANLATEAQTKITALLGSRGYDAYKQYGGQWLQQLQSPRAATPGATGGTMILTPGR